MANFHDIRFPLEIALGARGGPERKTEIVTKASGFEERNTIWAHSRRKYDAGYGIKSISRLNEVLAFFEERRGRLYGFRFRDRLDWTSAPGNMTPTNQDQRLGTGNGNQREFQLCKTYGGVFAPYIRPITHPVAGSVLVAVDSQAMVMGVDYTLGTNGLIKFEPTKTPAFGTNVSAGFVFDVPVRFDNDFLEVDLNAFEAGVIPSIPLIEIRVCCV